MPLRPDEIRNLRSITSVKASRWERQPDLSRVGQDIYDLLNIRPQKRGAWKKRMKDVQIKPDHLYGPKEVKVVLGVSYDTAVRTMERMKRTANLAKPRAKKRLLRVKGSDLRDYIQGKLE
jgi:hypothetical protein